MAKSPVIYARVGEYVIRRADLNDLQSIIDIDNDLLLGLDYMPAMYYKFLQAEGDLALVVEHSGTPIQLFIIGFVDSDPTVAIFMGGRIVKSKRGQGIARVLREAVDELLQQKFPQLRHGLFVTGEEHKRPGSYQILQRMHALYCYSTSERVRSGLAQYQPQMVPGSSFRRIKYEEALEILDSGNQFEDFLSRYSTDFTLGMLGVWRPVKINNKRALKKQFAAATQTFITVEDENLSGNECKGDKPRPKLGRITSLSYGYVLPVKRGVCNQIIFFGDDPSIAARHEIEHSRHLASISSAEICITFMVPDKVKVDQLTAITDRIIGKHENFYNDHAVLGKRPLAAQAKL